MHTHSQVGALGPQGPDPEEEVKTISSQLNYGFIKRRMSRHKTNKVLTLSKSNFPVVLDVAPQTHTH